MNGCGRSQRHEQQFDGGVCGDERIWAAERDARRRGLGHHQRRRHVDDECYTKRNPDGEYERLCDFIGRDRFVRYDWQYRICRDHGIQHAGVSHIACMEDGECRHKLDGLDWDRVAGRSGERLAGGFTSGGGLCGHRRRRFCQFDDYGELDGSRSGAWAGGVGDFAGRSGDGAAAF